MALTRRIALFLAAVAVFTAVHAQEDEVERIRLPGLIATYRLVGHEQPAFVRMDAAPAFLLAADEAPDPRLPSQGWTAEWRGVLEVLRPGKYRFAARRNGALSMRIDGGDVALPAADDEHPAASEPVELSFGLHDVEFRYEATGTSGQRLRLDWESDDFPREPLPAHALGHAGVSREDDAGGSLARAIEIKALVEDPFPVGRLLVEEHGCVACHRPSTSSPLSEQLLARPGPRLSKAGGRLRTGWIYHWLADPQALRPEAVMPRMFSKDRRGEIERYAVARYLESLAGPLPETNTPLVGPNEPLEALGREQFVRTGCVVCHEPQNGLPPRVALTGLGRKTTSEALGMFLRRTSAVDPAGRMPDFALEKADAEGIALYLIRRDSATAPPLELPESPTIDELRPLLLGDDPNETEAAEFAASPLDRDLRIFGRRVMHAKRCTACHEMKPAGEEDPAHWEVRFAQADFTAIAAAPGRGCLAPADVPGPVDVPRYGAGLDRERLAEFLSIAVAAPGTKAPGELARLTLVRFNCVGCHQRDGAGGLSSELLGKLSIDQTAESAELISPPTLTGPTDRLLGGYLRRVLEEDFRARPWMGLRMPRFGKENVRHLPAGLAALDGHALQEEAFAPPADPELAAAGRTLVGSKGFGCTKCHDMLDIASRGTRGPELSRTAERVNYDWFLRWMTDPQRIQPGTRMPTVFLDGRSPHQNVLDGDPARQRLAIWQYLSIAKELAPPEGLEEPSVATLDSGDRPLVFRTFLPGVTPRSMAIRFPNQVHLAYDAQACRLAYGWTGDFLDTEPVWGGRGGNRAGIKGPIFWTAPAGFPWEVTRSSMPVPDFTNRGGDIALGGELPDDGLLHERRLHFRGYRTRDDGPAFRFELELPEGGSTKFVEAVSPLKSDAGVGALRSTQINAPAGGFIWWKVADADAPPRWRTAAGDEATLGEGAIAPTPAVLELTQHDKPLVLHMRAAPSAAIWLATEQAGKWAVVVRTPADADGAAVRLALALWAPVDGNAEKREAIVAEEVRQVTE